MSETPSSMLPLGTRLPEIRLTNAVDGRQVDVRELAKGKRGTAVLVICNHCPYVVHIHRELVKAAHEAIELGLAVVAVNSNDLASHPQDGPGPMAELANAEGWRFPFLFDETQEVARALHAECTPDLFVFDAEAKLAYRGQFDDSRPRGGKPVTGKDLRAAVKAVAAAEPVTGEQIASVGCNIKWRR